MRLYWMAFTAIFAATLLALTGAASASITVDIMDSRGFYGPGQGLEGGLIFTHDQPVPANSFVHASIDSGPVISSQNASAYAGNSTNVFAQQPFGYNVTLSGTSSWNETPNQTFDYKYRVSYVDKDGLPVSQEFGKSKGTVSQTEGVKFIDDATEFVLPENSTNVAYQEIANVNPKVLTTMRMACAGQEYGIDRDDVKLNGWIFKTLRVDLFPPEPGSNNRSANIEAFDNKSLDRGFTMFGGPGVPFPHGGIYKGLVYQEYGKDAIWNGTDGFIKIIDFDDNALYEMAFLPPNGPSLCAYTGFTIPNSTQWIGFLPDSGSVRFGETFSRDYRKDTLIGQLASACPSRSRTCDIAADSFGAIKTSDAAGGVQLSYDDTDASIFTVSAATTLPVSTTNRTFSIGFADFLSLNAPSSRGIHLLTFTLKSGSSTLASSTTNFTVCLDNDGDGYCIESGDCKDDNAAINPDTQEMCNGRDDDCDAAVDEGFQLGQSCGVGICTGLSICSGDGRNATCSVTGTPKNEICGDGMDNDCDGYIDEASGIEINGVPQTCEVVGPLCAEGETRPCQGAAVGECRPGSTRCVGGRFTASCEGAVNPVPEVCSDFKDNNCNGITDDPFICNPTIPDPNETGDACDNGMQDIDEDGVDCGGPCPDCAPKENLLPLIGIGAGGIIIAALAAFLVFRRRAARQEEMEELEEE